MVSEPSPFVFAAWSSLRGSRRGTATVGREALRTLLEFLHAGDVQPMDTGTAAGKCFLDMLGVTARFETNARATAGRRRQGEGGGRLQGPATSIETHSTPAQTIP
jgi:hypothetical protein